MNDWVWIAVFNSCLSVPMNKRQNIWKQRWCIYHRKNSIPSNTSKKIQRTKRSNSNTIRQMFCLPSFEDKQNVGF